MLLIHSGARPSPATQAMRMITAVRSSQVASVKCQVVLVGTGSVEDFTDKAQDVELR